jgi:predicted PurR-regulated permease PerM
MDPVNRAFKILFYLSLLALLLLFLTSVGDLVKLVVVSALLAYIIDPLAVFLESRGMTRTTSTAVIFLSFSLLAAIFITLLLPLLTTEIAAIQEGISSGEGSAMLARIDNIIEEKLGFLGIKPFAFANKLQQATEALGNWFFSHLLDIVSLVTNLVIIPFIVFFFLKDGREIKKQLIGLVPNRYFEFSLNLLHKMDLQMGNYLRGQLLDAIIFGIMSVVALWGLGIKYFLVIGIIAGVANLVPFLGPVAGASAAVIVSLINTGDFRTAGFIIVAFVVMKLIDDSIVQPLVVARSVDLHPLVVLLVVIVGGKFFGILGMLLSVPVTGFIKVIIAESTSTLRRYRLT